MNEHIDLLQPQDLIEQIRASITSLQSFVTNEHNEVDRNTVYFALEGIRTQTELLDNYLSLPFMDRITAKEIRNLAQLLQLNKAQVESLVNNC